MLKKWATVADRYLKFMTKEIYERHFEAEDIIQEFNLRVLSKTRNWNPEEEPDFNQFAYSSFKSIIEGLVSARKIVEPEVQTVFNNESDEEQVSIYDKIGTDKDIILSNIEINEKLERMFKKVLGDPTNPDDECGLVLLLWKEGLSNKDIAEYFNNDIRKVENIKKRIRYKLNP